MIQSSPTVTFVEDDEGTWVGQLGKTLTAGPFPWKKDNNFQICQIDIFQELYSHFTFITLEFTFVKMGL